MIDVMNHCYADEYGCNFTSIIPTNITDLTTILVLRGHVIPGLIHKCYNAKKDGTDSLFGARELPRASSSTATTSPGSLCG